MRKILLLTLVYLLNSPVLAMTLEQANRIYVRIIIKNNLKIPIRPLRIAEIPLTIKVDGVEKIANQYNAYADPLFGVTSISRAALTRSVDEIALILGHEIAHHTGHYNERSADIAGARYTYNAGYSVCKGRNWFRFLYIEGIGVVGGKLHPKSMDRYKYLGHFCNKKGK